MSFTSYSQNFEDVMLWRALSHIEKGLYIDVGAQDPIVDSVSLAFHERGWRGVHVEPTPYYAELLRQKRAGDTVIEAAVGNGRAVLRFFEVPGTGISTGDADIAARHRERGFDMREVYVPCIPLEAIYEVVAGEEIHWLKVDVEGLEAQVLGSWRASTARPWVVVVESTLPLTQTDTHEDWEPILLGYGYVAVYFDGLNRYYISDEHPELEEAFGTPPNVFDGFSLSGTASSTFHKQVEGSIRGRGGELLSQGDYQRVEANLQLKHLVQAFSQAELVHSEHQRQWDDDKRGFVEQLRAAHEDLRDLQQERIRREQALSEQSDYAQQQLETVLHSMAQREQDFGEQLIAIQRQAADERTEQASAYVERERVLHRAHSAREQALKTRLDECERERLQLQEAHLRSERALAEQSSIATDAMERQLREQVKREQDVGREISEIQGTAAQGMAEMARVHRNEERVLLRDHEQRQQEWIQQKKALVSQVTDLAADIQALHHAQHALEASLKAALLLEQQTVQQLREALARTQHALDDTQASLSWRITAPLRKLAKVRNTVQTLGVTPTGVEQLLAADVGERAVAPVAPTFVATGVADASTGEVTAKHAHESTMAYEAQCAVRDVSLPHIESVMFSSPPPIDVASETRASTLNELLGYHDRQFVSCSYRTLLGRTPDPEGLGYYLGRLRAGTPKVQLLKQMRLSPEGKAHAASVPGLDAAIRRYGRGQLPLIGWLFRHIDRIEGNGSFECRLRVIESQLFVLGLESEHRVNRIEAAIAGLPQFVIEHHKSVSALLEGTPVSADVTLASDTSGEARVAHLSPRARNIYRQMASAAATYARRGV
ncbi:FkbM family methyltransferase [Paraburkholderia hospita]|uniref:FkbM family methyltransferase n=1 Tax=Paraburkholderia hospita TaxID=169430 RepID=UPI0006858716|nr:FkbM family methyltransferase [Paraburkholderia hospita]